MAVTVMYGGNDTYNALLYGATKHPGTVDFLQNQLSQLSDISQTLTEAGRSFINRAKDVYEQFNGSEAMRLARAAVRKISSVFQTNEVCDIKDVGGMQTAAPIMQRYIMAEPTIRQMYHEQRLDGYSDTYVDMFPGQVGEKHYDYRRVVDTMLIETPDNEEIEWKITNYAEDLLDGDVELSMSERVDVLSVWDRIQRYVKLGDEDPTSAFGGKL